MVMVMEKMIVVLLAATTAVAVLAADGEKVPSCVVTMKPCESYLLQTSTEKEPTKECCTAFGKVIKDDKSCMCTAVADPTSPYAKDVDVVRAMKLPGECSVNFGLRNCTTASKDGKAAPTPDAPKSEASHSPPSSGGSSVVASPPPPAKGAAASVPTISLSGLVIGGFFLLLGFLAA